MSNLYSNILLNNKFIINSIILIFLIMISFIFFEKSFKIYFSKKSIFAYILLNLFSFSLGIFFNNYILGFIISTINSIIFIIFVQKTSKLLTLSYFCIKTILVFNIQFFTSNIFSMISNYDSQLKIIELPLCGTISVILISTTVFFIKHFSKNIHLNETLILSIQEKSKLIITSCLINLTILFSILYFFNDFIIKNLYYLFIIDIYFHFSISNIVHLCNKLYTSNKIKNLNSYNSSILDMYDDTRAFKHDFHNIIQAIGGYIANDDINGLKSYYTQISCDCKNINNLCKLNSNLINNPAIYSIFVDKYNLANKYNIQLNLEILIDLNSLNIKIYEFTRILGILLDNAIEASKECSFKNINILFKEDKYKQLLIIENTYSNKDISVDKIFEKNYTTKPNNTGLGLWEVNKILSKNSNLNLYTHKNEDYFSQQLEIYCT